MFLSITHKQKTVRRKAKLTRINFAYSIIKYYLLQRLREMTWLFFSALHNILLEVQSFNDKLPFDNKNIIMLFFSKSVNFYLSTLECFICRCQIPFLKYIDFYENNFRNTKFKVSNNKVILKLWNALCRNAESEMPNALKRRNFDNFFNAV